MLRATAVDERYLTSYTAYRTSGGLAPGGELRHAAENARTKKKKPAASPTGNRTPVTRVTGGYTDHYTIEEEAMSEQASQTE